MGACCSGGSAAEINKTAVDLTHFDLLKVVGKGGFGKVNAVEHRLTGTLYALKTIEKALLLKNDSNRSTVWMEREVMARFRSHFLVHLKYAFQDKSFLYLVMNFMKGGDLRFHLDNHGPLNEDHTRFYMAEMLLGLQEMNSLGIVYRDLKPENVLLDEGGHLRISDFGLCSQLKAERGWMTYGESGTPGYLAPEVLTKQKYNNSQDVWSFGIVLFEFLHNHLPFDVNNRDEVISGDFRVKSSLSAEVKDLLKGLLTKDPNKRLGMGAAKWEDVKQHPWFKSIDWKKADELRLTPPFQPDPDVANCSSVFDLEDQLLYVHKDIEFSPADQKKFEGFEYHTAVTAEEIAAMIKSKKEGKTPGTPASPGAGTSSAKNGQTPSNHNQARSDKNMNPNPAIPGKVKVMLKENMVPAGTVGGPNGPANTNAANGVDSKRHAHRHGEEKGVAMAATGHHHPPLNGATLVGSTAPTATATATATAHTTSNAPIANGAPAVPGLGAAIASVSNSHPNGAAGDSATPSPSTQTIAVKSGIPHGKKADGGGPLFVHTVPVNGGDSTRSAAAATPIAAAAALATPSTDKPIIDEKLIPLATTTTSPSITGSYGAPVPNGGIASGMNSAHGSGGGDAEKLAAALAAASSAGGGASSAGGDPNAVNGNTNALPPSSASSAPSQQPPITLLQPLPAGAGGGDAVPAQ